MKYTEPSALERRICAVTRAFQASAQRHLLLTGSKGCGKTTLIHALTQGAMPGVRSFLERDENGSPLRVLLSDWRGNGLCVIGQRQGDTMIPVTRTLDEAGAALLRSALTAPGHWICIDEIGYLEEASPIYQQALWRAFEEKRVLAALRKADTPLLRGLRGRRDCLVLDLDLI